ncbi:MAG: ATP-grasp domain-containing protein [Elusimicrobiota bacterium]
MSRFSAWIRAENSIKNLNSPLVVKPLSEEASIGISQGSFVDDKEHLYDRIAFIHNSFRMHAIAEEYIAGRELYVSILGNKQLKVLPVREMTFTNVPDEDPKMATYKAKWDKQYRKKWGIENGFANNLPDSINEKIINLSKKAYRALNITGYGRLDLRLSSDNEIYVIEANANPALAPKEDLAMSAAKAGIPYESLIRKIINLALKV